MFSRKLSEREIEMIGIVEGFVRERHAHNIGHDYSHISEVTRRAIEIAQILPEPVDPFVLICGALFHDLGRVGFQQRKPFYRDFFCQANDGGGGSFLCIHHP